MQSSDRACFRLGRSWPLRAMPVTDVAKIWKLPVLHVAGCLKWRSTGDIYLAASTRKYAGFAVPGPCFKLGWPAPQATETRRRQPPALPRLPVRENYCSQASDRKYLPYTHCLMHNSKPYLNSYSTSSPQQSLQTRLLRVCGDRCTGNPEGLALVERE